VGGKIDPSRGAATPSPEQLSSPPEAGNTNKKGMPEDMPFKLKT
jgi:hypothetical protein